MFEDNKVEKVFAKYDLKKTGTVNTKQLGSESQLLKFTC